MPSTLRIATAAVLTAVTFVIGYVRLPLPATQGIFTLADIAIFFAAFTFGPLTGAIAGGAGAALIDLIGGTAPYAPVSLVVHGLEGLVAGVIAVGMRRTTQSGSAMQSARPDSPKEHAPARLLSWLLAGVVGTVILAGGYFLAEVLFFGGPGKAITEVLPNVAQGVVGAIGGALLTVAVRRAYPPVQSLRW